MVEVVTGAQNHVMFWNTKDFAQKRTVKPFPGVGYNLSSLSWNSSNTKLSVVPKWGDKIAVCDFKDDILTWSFLTHKESRSFTSGCLLNNTRYLLTGCDDATVLVWDLKNKNSIKTFQGHKFPVMSVARNASDQLMASGGQDGRILLHSIGSSVSQQAVDLTHDQLPSNKSVTKLRFSPKEKALMGSTSEDGVVCVWSTESQRLLSKFTTAHTGVATDLCFSPNNNMLMISVGMDAKINCFDIQQRKSLTQVSAPTALASVIMLQDGTTLLAGGADGKLYVYELRSVKVPREVISAHKSAITCIEEQSHIKPSGRSSSVRGSSSSKRKGHASPAKSTPSVVFADSPAIPELHSTSAATSTAELLAGTSSAQLSATQTPIGSSTTDAFSSSSLKPQIDSAPVSTISSQESSANGKPPASQQSTNTDSIPPPATHLSIQTPLMPHAKLDSGMGPGLVMSMPALATPAGVSFAQTSGIFSPLDDHLATPLSVAKATATVPPTTRAMEKAALTGSKLTSDLPLQTPAHIPGRMGVFSPLEYVQYPLITPGVLRQPHNAENPPLNVHHHPPPNVHHNPPPPTAASSAHTPSSATVSEQHSISESVDGDLLGRESLVLQHSHQPLPSTGSSHHHPSLLTQPPLPSPLTQPSHHHPSTLTQPSPFSAGDASLRLADIQSTLDKQPPSSPHHSSPPFADEKQAITSIASPSTSTRDVVQPSSSSSSGIQMQYLENMIKDSQEELWYAVHKDVRALSLDMFRQFFAMQQEFTSAFAALNDKVEKLSEQNRQLQEQVHQYRPKH